MMRRSPIKRTGFKPTGSGILRVQAQARTAPAKKAAMKSKGPRMTPIRKSARGEECTLRFACCNGDTETTVWCHSNRAEDGKGMGVKARDEEGCYGCSACHAWLDGGYALHMPRATVDAFFDLARALSQKILRRKGLMK